VFCERARLARAYRGKFAQRLELPRIPSGAVHPHNFGACHIVECEGRCSVGLAVNCLRFFSDSATVGGLQSLWIIHNTAEKMA
jgi:hypothetical protein